MDRVYAAQRHGLQVLERSDNGWVVRSRRFAEDLECVAGHPAAPERVFVGSLGEGLYRSTDGGERFERVGDSVIEPRVTSVAVARTDPAVVLAGTEPSRVYRSADGGTSWERVDGLETVPSSDEWSFPPRPDTHHVRWIAIHPTDPDRWYVGIEAGALLLTDDGGRTWQDRPAGSRRDNHTLATHPSAPDRVYSAAGDGYAESADGGETWELIEDGLGHHYVWGLAVDAGNPDRRLVSAASGASRAHRIASADSYVYRRRGDGPWERLSGSGLPTGEGVLRAALAAGPDGGEFVAANNRGAYLTRDGGDRWQAIVEDWPGADGDAGVRAVLVR